VRLRMMVLCGLMIAAAGPITLAQTPAPAAPQAMPAAAAANPVVWSAKFLYQHNAHNMIAAAQEMPADKYSYHPTADQWTFGKLVSHIAESNAHLCGALSGKPASPALTVSETAPKADLVAALQASFDFCSAALDGLTDAQLKDPVTFFGRQFPRATALMALTADLPDHYSQMASYLRLNGLLPPSAQPKKPAK
jgi:uncharacterized damage-inducible protein DinB